MNDAAVFLTSGGPTPSTPRARSPAVSGRWQGSPSAGSWLPAATPTTACHAYGTSLAGIEANARGWGVLVPDVRHVRRDDTATLVSLLEREGEQVAAVIGEPVVGAGGVYPPAEGYWARVRALCDQHDVVLIADEVGPSEELLTGLIEQAVRGTEPAILRQGIGRA